jgi:hypothetical protein
LQHITIGCKGSTGEKLVPIGMPTPILYEPGAEVDVDDMPGTALEPVVDDPPKRHTPRVIVTVDVP